MKHSVPTDNRRGSLGASGWLAIGVIAIAAIGFIFLVMSIYDHMHPGAGQTYSIINSNGQPNPGVQSLAATPSNCPTDLATTATLTQQNILNASGTEAYDSTCYLYNLDANGNPVYSATITNTSGGSASLTCGKPYVLRCVSSSTTSSMLLGLLGGDGATLFDQIDSLNTYPNGTAIPLGFKAIKFTPNARTYALSWTSKQHNTLQFRAYDTLSKGLMYDSGDASASDYELTGVNFSSTTGNTTATAVGSGGTYAVQIEAQETQPDTDFSDLGTYILVDASTATWQSPTTAKWTSASGTQRSLANIKGTLDPSEGNLWTNYEYAYFVPDSIRSDSVLFDLVIKAIPGINPSGADSLVVTFASKGAAVPTVGGANTGTLRYSGATDASSPAAIYTVQTVNLATS